MNSVYYSQADVEMLRDLFDFGVWFRMSYVYQSNWRVLHVDGFEGNLWPIPLHRGRRIQFFHYAETRAS